MTTQFGDPLPVLSADAPEQSVFRILVIADLGSPEVWGKPVSIDRDNFEEVMTHCAARIRLPDDSGGSDIPLTGLEDLHPDRMFAELEVFQALRQRRRRLQNDKTFADEAHAILQAQPEDSSAETADEPSAELPSGEDALDPADLLSQTVERTEEVRAPIIKQIAEGTLSIDALVSRLIEPHLLEKSDPRKPEFIAAVDEAIAETMRQILHAPAFQQIEATWRGLWMLIKRLETDRTLQISVLNVPRQDLHTDLCRHDDLTKSRLHGLLMEPINAPGADPFTLVVGDYYFDAGPDDTELLGRLARVHAAAGAVFVASAVPAVVGCSNLETTADPDDWESLPAETTSRWEQLRGLSPTSSLVLTMPRVLGRLPYGQSSDPIESFAFEEMPEGSSHNAYLWVNGAFPVATRLGQTFSRAGWSVRAAWDPEFDRLPTHIYRTDLDTVVKPCGEVELSLRAGEVLSSFGLTAIHSVRDSDKVLIPAVRALEAEDQLTAAWT